MSLQKNSQEREKQMDRRLLRLVCNRRANATVLGFRLKLSTRVAKLIRWTTLHDWVRKHGECEQGHQLKEDEAEHEVADQRRGVLRLRSLVSAWSNKRASGDTATES
jgi:hypothetical protein